MRAILFALAAGVLISAAVAQPPSRGGDGRPENVSGVYLPQSPEAEERLAQARRLAAAGQWDQAAELLERVRREHADKIIIDDNLGISVSEAVARALLDWPSEGLAAYRRRVDPAARQAYEQAVAAGGSQALAAVARAFWLSSIGPRAAEEAAELAMEDSRFIAAAELWERLADRYAGDGRTHEQAVALARQAVALRAAGLADRAEVVRTRLADMAAAGERIFPDRPGSPTVGQWVERYWNWRPAGRAVTTAPDYPMLGGGPSRAGGSAGDLAGIAAESEDRIISPLWELPLKPDQGPPPTPRRSASPSAPQPGRAFEAAVLPAIAENVAFVHNQHGVTAVSLSGSRRLWTNTEFKVGQLNVSRGDGQMRGGQVVSPTWTGGRLYVTFGRADANYNPFGGRSDSSPAGVACLDAGTGRRLWKLDVTSLPQLKSTTVDAGPLVMDGRLFVLARAVEGFTFDTCTLIAAEAASGKVLWHRRLNTGRMVGSAYYSVVRTPDAIIAGQDNAVYVATNLGTVAAVSADTGELRWMRRYDRIGVETDESGRPAVIGPAIAAGCYCPTMVWNGRVIALPPDSRQLLVIDAATGRLESQLDRVKLLYNATELYGVVDGKLYGRGSQVFCWNLAAGRLVWARSPEVDPTWRGCLAGKSLYLPTRDGLIVMDLAGGRQRLIRWAEGGDGLVLLAGRQMLVVNNDRLAGYMRWDHARQECLAAIAADPSSPEPLLDYARRAAATGRHELAHEQLAKAVEVGGGFASLTDDALKSRVFDAAMDYARQAAAEKSSAALPLLELAGMCPPDMDGHVRYRMALGDYWAANGDGAKAVRYFHEVLADEELRSRLCPGDDGQTKFPAGMLARRRIAALGSGAYAAIAARADLAYSQAVEAGDWDELRRLAAEYPNADRTADELFRLAEHYAEAGDHAAAVDVLGELGFWQADRLGKDDALQLRRLTLLAKVRLGWAGKLGGAAPADKPMGPADRQIALAYVAVRDAAARRPDEQVNLAGVTASLRSHRDRLAGSRAVQPISPPALGSRLDEERPVLARLMVPPVDGMPDGRTGLVMGINSILAVRAGNVVWTGATSYMGQPTLIGGFAGLAVVGDSRQIYGVDLETGRNVWMFKPPEPHPFGPPAAGEGLLFVPVRGKAAAWLVDLDGGRGRLIELPCPVAASPHVRGRTICYIGSNPKGARQLVVLDRLSGEQIKLPGGSYGGGAPTWCEPDESGARVAVANNGLVAMVDVQLGTLWRRGSPVLAADLCPQGLFTVQRSGNAFTISKHDTQTGDMLRQVNIPVAADPDDAGRDGGMGVNPDVVRVQAHGGQVFVSNAMFLACIDAASGKLSWKAMTGRQEAVTRVIVGTTVVAALCVEPLQVVDDEPRAWRVNVRLYDRSSGGGRLLATARVETADPSKAAMAAAGEDLLVQIESGRIRVFRTTDR